MLVLAALQVTVESEKPEEKLLCIDLHTYLPAAQSAPLTAASPAKTAAAKTATVKKPVKPVVAEKPVKARKSVETKQVPEPKTEPVAVAKHPDAIDEQPVAVAVACPPVEEAAQPNAEAVPSHGITAVETIPETTPEQRYFEQHVAEISRLLQENLYYPRMARKRGITGEVIVAFELLQNGEARSIVVRSGDRSVLNKAAIETIERLSGEFPRPDRPLTLNVPIRYQLQ